jgi:hypothetical protein
MGQLVQIDASPFAWLEARGPAMTLHGAIDDATRTVLALHFRPTEDLHGSAIVFQQLFTQYGRPLAIYGDRINILVRNDAHWSLAEQLQGAQDPTHLGRGLHALGIGYLEAGSPEATGRVERLWRTLQDRLSSELRLRHIPTPEGANAFLPEFLEDLNPRFTRPPRDPAPAWRVAPRDRGSCNRSSVQAAPDRLNDTREIVMGMGYRRAFLRTLAGVLAMPRVTLAQESGRTYRLGWLSSAAPRTESYNVAFAQRLRELGFVEGRNLVIEFRNAEGRSERLPDLAADLGRQNCDLLIAPGGEPVLVAIKQASRDTPIVVVAGDYDPAAAGHAASLARPGGRITGVTVLQTELPAKRLELLKEVLPNL